MKGRIVKVCTSFIDVPDEIAVAVYFAGCSIRCKDCHNPELWDPKSGEEMSEEEVIRKVKKNSLAEWVVFEGGEPPDQLDFLIRLCEKITFHKKALYTGREFEDLSSKLTELLDLIICGPYKGELYVKGRWPASSNQRAFRKEEKLWICDHI